MIERTSAPPQGTSQNRPQHFTGPRTHRQARVLRALSGTPHSREALDREARTSNSPELVRQLRCAGLDLPCDRVAVAIWLRGVGDEGS